MTRFRFGTLVLLGTAAFTLAIAQFVMSPQDSATVACEPLLVAPTPVPVAPPEPKVLYVESVAGPLQRTLARDLDVTARTPSAMPRSADEFARYDLVVLSDVPMHLLDPHRVDALDAYVRGGGSLLVAGGADSFGSGGYEATTLEKLLPARFDSGCRTDAPDLAIVIVVDQSVAMRGGPMDDTRKAIRLLSESLSPNDYVAVIGFDDDAHTRVRTQRAANRRRIAEQVMDLVPSERTGGNLYAGLRAADDILDNIHAASKHVIVVAGSETPLAHLTELTADMRTRGITASAVAIHGADRDVLAAVAERGDGRLYVVGGTGALPEILVREAAKAPISDDDRVRVRIPKGGSALYAGVVDAPPLHGYVSMRTKPAAETLLVSDHNDEPLLARWCHDAGTVLVWTSDLDHAWSGEWVRWNGYTTLWSRVIRASARGATACPGA